MGQAEFDRPPSMQSPQEDDQGTTFEATRYPPIISQLDFKMRAETLTLGHCYQNYLIKDYFL
jgi:hypothetical protein